jgi:serine/threonine-protein kinase
LKVLPEEGRQDAGTLARFRLEAQAGCRLNHPNIVRTYKLGQCEDIYGLPVHYVVMELVRGVNLYELLVLKRQIEISQACDIIFQASEALDYAHRSGLIHRDIKPENLLICADGSVKILDFGLAMIDENDEEFSMAMIFGRIGWGRRITFLRNNTSTVTESIIGPTCTAWVALCTLR